jgi:hypothetical protein
MSIVETTDDGNADILWGCAAIAAVIRKNTRATYYLLESGSLPAKKIGRQWAASRRKLLAAIIGDESAV